MEHEKTTLFGKEYYLVPINTEDHLSDTAELEDKYDNLRKYIGRSGDALCIFGGKMLKSLILDTEEITICYDNSYRDDYNDQVNFEETTLGELKYGDIFIMEYELREVKLQYINIFLLLDTEEEAHYQYLTNTFGIESIDSDISFCELDRKVIKALRY